MCEQPILSQVVSSKIASLTSMLSSQSNKYEALLAVEDKQLEVMEPMVSRFQAMANRVSRLATREVRLLSMQT